MNKILIQGAFLKSIPVTAN
uniref:Uncharacterized protein n=1 Tax=Romanomermis culicivorax TaxID=13658 RepID=A0A915IJ32_ROMCU